MPFTPYNPEGSFTPYGSSPQKKPMPNSALGSGFDNFSVGVAKGALNTIKGLGTIGERALNQTAGRVVSAVQGKGFTPTQSGESIYNPNSTVGQRASQLLTPQGTGENIGYATEKLAEFFVPGKLASRGELAINLISKGITKPVVAAATRIAGKGLVQGLSAGGVRFAQTGGDVKESAKTAATAGITRGVLATAGEAARAANLPERFYSIIFKNSKKDMLAELKSNGLANLRQTNPQKYQEFVDQGLIKTGVGGKPILNETLAEQALARGLKGSDMGMANEVVTKTLETESKVQKILAGYKKPVSIKEPQYVKVLKKVAADYEDVGFGEISNEANTFAELLTKNKGSVTGLDALKVRRFLDKMRFATSYDKPASSLSQTQSNFKTLSDALRGKLNSIPGVGNLMKDYSFYIDALETLAANAARKGNNQLFSLIDSVLLGGGIAGGNPVAASVGIVARNTLKSSPFLTKTGQALANPNLGPKASSLLQSGSAGVQSFQTDQTGI